MGLKKQILILDDDKFIRLILTKIFDQLDLNVTEAASINEARKYLQDNKDYDLLMIDLIMPGETGWQLIEEINKEEKFKDLPIIVFTGLELSESEAKKLTHKVTDIIYKANFNIEEFKSKIKSILKN